MSSNAHRSRTTLQDSAVLQCGVACVPGDTKRAKPISHWSVCTLGCFCTKKHPTHFPSASVSSAYVSYEIESTLNPGSKKISISAFRRRLFWFELIIPWSVADHHKVLCSVGWQHRQSLVQSGKYVTWIQKIPKFNHSFGAQVHIWLFRAYW